MALSRVRPPMVADERTQLVGWLDLQRALVRWKCEGVSEEDAHRPVLASSPLMTLAGVVAHLRWTEDCWFQVLFLGKDTGNPQFHDPDDGDMMVADVPLAQLLDEYERQCALSNEVVAAHSFDDVGSHPDFDGASLRWILIHMVEETARHVGHLDAIREQLDGTVGYF